MKDSKITSKQFEVKIEEIERNIRWVGKELGKFGINMTFEGGNSSSFYHEDIKVILSHNLSDSARTHMGIYNFWDSESTSATLVRMYERWWEEEKIQTNPNVIRAFNTGDKDCYEKAKGKFRFMENKLNSYEKDADFTVPIKVFTKVPELVKVVDPETIKKAQDAINNPVVVHRTKGNSLTPEDIEEEEFEYLVTFKGKWAGEAYRTYKFDVEGLVRAITMASYAYSGYWSVETLTYLTGRTAEELAPLLDQIDLETLKIKDNTQEEKQK